MVEGRETVGVPDCDEYLAFMKGCLERLPPETRAAIDEALTSARAAWAEGGEPEVREGFAEGCRTALESVRTSGMCSK